MALRDSETPADESAPRGGAPPPQDPIARYGHYPALFWDLRSEEAIDVEHPSILARILTQGSLEMIAELVPLDVARRELPSLPMPEHARRFWQVVLERISPAAGADARG